MDMHERQSLNSSYHILAKRLESRMGLENAIQVCQDNHWYGLIDILKDQDHIT